MTDQGNDTPNTTDEPQQAVYRPLRAATDRAALRAAAELAERMFTRQLISELLAYEKHLADNDEDSYFNLDRILEPLWILRQLPKVVKAREPDSRRASISDTERAHLISTAEAARRIVTTFAELDSGYFEEPGALAELGHAIHDLATVIDR